MSHTDPEPLRRILYRFLQDLLTESLPDYWERRARTFDAVGTPQCDEIAQACRNKAQVLRWYGPDPDVLAVVEDALGEIKEAA